MRIRNNASEGAERSPFGFFASLGVRTLAQGGDPPSPWRRLAFAAAIAAVLVCPFPAPAATAPGNKEGDEPALREQSIYLPYEKLWQVFEKDNRGVFLPYEEFIKLWKQAETGRQRPAAVKPPTDAMITELSARAAISHDVMQVDADIGIELLAKGWIRVPLGLRSAAITRAVVDERPARILRRAGGGYDLLVQKTDDAPQALALKLTFARSFTKTPGRNSVTFETPRAPLSRWDVRIPERGVKVEIQPLVAATDVPVAADAAETRVLAFVGAASDVTVEWTPRAEGARGMEALANVKAEQQVFVDEGVVRTRATLAYEISRAELSQLDVEVPEGHKVVNVFDENVREWSVAQTGRTQKATAVLFQPTKGSQRLIVELERFAEEATVSAPVVRALGVSRQQGIVVVRMGAGLRAEPVRREALLQVDPRELAASLKGERWEFAYRYAAVPFALDLAVEKIQPRIVADALLEAHLDPESLTLDLHTIADVQKTGVFQLEIEAPPEFEVHHVRGIEHAGVQAAAVDSHHRAAGTGGVPARITVNLARRAEGRVGLAVQFHRRLREADLLTPTGKSASIPLRVPRLVGPALERQNGRLVVYCPESLRVNPADLNGLRPAAYADAVRGMPAAARGAAERPALSFLYADQSASLTLAAERRAPHVTVRQLLVARIEAGVAKYEATFFHDILFSGVKSLRLDLPSDLADKARVSTPGLRHSVVPPAPADAVPSAGAAGFVAWRIEGDTEFMGSARYSLQWEQNIDNLDVGKSVELRVPRLVPREADRAWGQIVLAKAEAIDVTAGGEPAGLRAIDPRQDLMDGAAVADAAQAFEFHADWALAVVATRYEPKDVKATSIERGLVRMVVTRGRMTSVQALYRVRSARQRLVVRLPGEATFDTQPLRINGRPASLEQGREGDYYVPLVGQPQDTPFLLELRYVVARAALKLRPPEFPQDPAVQHVYLSLFLPEDRTYLGSVGPWTDEFVWVLKGFNTWPRGNKSSDALLAWVSRGLSVDRATLNDFATDGRHILFSTLRPDVGTQGALRIVSVRAWAFQTVVLFLIVVLGLGLLPLAAVRRVLAVGVGLTVMTLMAVFTPSAARAVVSNGTVAAVLIVLVIWALWHLLVTRPRRPRLPAPKQASAAPPRVFPPETPAEGDAAGAPPPDIVPSRPAEGGLDDENG